MKISKSPNKKAGGKNVTIDIKSADSSDSSPKGVAKAIKAKQQNKTAPKVQEMNTAVTI